MHKVKVTVRVDGELEYEYERSIQSEAEVRRLALDLQLAVVNVPGVRGERMTNDRKRLDRLLEAAKVSLQYIAKLSADNEGEFVGKAAQRSLRGLEQAINEVDDA